MHLLLCFIQLSEVFVSVENPILEHESRDHYVIVDNIELSQNSLTNLAPTLNRAIKNTDEAGYDMILVKFT